MIFAIAALWVGTGLRLWTTWRTPSTQNVYRSNRYHFTAGVLLVAASFSFRAFGDNFDEAVGIPNLGDLLWHLLLIVAGAFVFLYTQGQRTGRLVRHPIAAATTLISAAAGLVLIGCWWASPIHHSYTPDLLRDGPPFGWALILYVAVFQIHFVAWIGRIAIRSVQGFLQAQRAAGPQARLVRRLRIAQSQGVMATGALLAVAGAAVTAYRALDPHLSRTDEFATHQVNTVLSFLAAFLVSVGFGIPVLMNLHSVSRDVRTLHPLWTALTRRRAHLDFGAARSSVRLPPFALALTTYRRDIGDALSRIHIVQPSAAEIVRATDPEAVLGQVLAKPGQWMLAAHIQHYDGPMARDLLEIPSRRPELEQLRRIATAFNSTQGAKAL